MNMTEQEAKTVAMLRCYFHCSWSKIGQLCAATWGKERAFSAAGLAVDDAGSQILGRDLCTQSEKALHECGIAIQDIDDMLMYEGVCPACKRADMFFHDAKESRQCPKCGGNILGKPKHEP